MSLKKPHSYKNSVVWCLTEKGLVIGDNNPETSGGEPVTVRRVWQKFSAFIDTWSDKFGVPAELVVATEMVKWLNSDQEIHPVLVRHNFIDIFRRARRCASPNMPLSGHK